MLHYDIHSELDAKHSDDFFRILSIPWEKNEENRYFIEQGLWLGGTLFNNLYKGLYENRNRRKERRWYGRHSRAEGIL